VTFGGTTPAAVSLMLRCAIADSRTGGHPLGVTARFRYFRTYFTKYQFSGLRLSVGLCGK
jgi:hypothetical protein